MQMAASKSHFMRLYVWCMIWIWSAEPIANSSSVPAPHHQLTIQKVSFTQKGYVQFLRYFKEVPPLTEYTFCIWMRSNNFTHVHPILSYSKNEHERLIRVWISNHGNALNLEIQSEPVFHIPLHFKENYWYHICQSWTSHSSLWTLHLNGKPHSTGFVPKLQGTVIPGGGDIVVGQEYTDIDKGLDDGIEGDVFGFNVVLAPAAQSPVHKFQTPSVGDPYELQRRRGDNNVVMGAGTTSYNHLPPFEPSPPDDVPNVISYFTSVALQQQQPQSDHLALGSQPHVRKRRGIMEYGSRLLRNFLSLFEGEPERPHTVRLAIGPIPKAHHYAWSASRRKQVSHPVVESITNELADDSMPQSVLNGAAGQGDKPLGQVLAELSYNCILGRGAPLKGNKVLISWTQTPVRVFGGALLKTVVPFCLPSKLVLS